MSGGIYPGAGVSDIATQLNNQLARELQMQQMEDEADFARDMAISAQKEQIRAERKIRDTFDRVNRRGTRKGFIVLMGMMAIIAWFVYYHVIDENEQLFFAMVLILVLMGAYAFWKMVRNEGALVGTTF